MPDWAYHTILGGVTRRLPRRFLRAWGESALGAATVRFLADSTTDPRIGAVAGRDTRALAAHLGAGFAVESGAGAREPDAALAQVASTGRAVLDIASGGPGLPKRVYEALNPAPTRSVNRGFVLLGVGMIVTGIVAWLVAATRVVLPYDESFADIPPSLLPFLAHDRMTLAGTMISIGVLYTAIARHASGARWVRRTFLLSGVVGFGNFFLFLAYGYFDPLHAALSASLFPLWLWGLRSPASPAGRSVVPDLRNDDAWRRAQWGTLGLVALSAGLFVGGIVIAVVGSTRVFVASDLAFLGGVPTDARLISWVAHDRAGFGGALASNALLIAGIALWGIRRGAAWLWWALLLAAFVGFGSTLGVHVAIGYTDVWHLAPVFLAAVMFALSMIALRPFLLDAPTRRQSTTAGDAPARE